MAKSIKNVVHTQRPAKPSVVNNTLANRLQATGDHTKPIRTVVILEVGDAKADEVREAISVVGASYRGNHPTFVCPARGGRITAEPIFEGAILDLVNKLCTVQDGKIVFKTDAHEVDVATYRL